MRDHHDIRMDSHIKTRTEQSYCPGFEGQLAKLANRSTRPLKSLRRLVRPRDLTLPSMSPSSLWYRRLSSTYWQRPVDMSPPSPRMGRTGYSRWIGLAGRM